MANPVLKENKVYPVFLDVTVAMVLMVNRDLLDLKVDRDPVVIQDRRETREIKEKPLT